MPPRISVVLAVHNAERYIDESVRSVLGQTFADFELIVIDDGSTDGTAGVLASLGQQDARIRIVCQPQRGLTASLATGIGLARGTYIARQDADDVSLPPRFARQLQYLEAHPRVAAVGAMAEIIDERGGVIGVLPTAHGVDAVARGILTVSVSPVHGSMLMRKAVVDQVGGYRGAFRMCQDYDLWLRIIAGFEMDNLPEVLYRWRLHEGAMSASRRTEQLRYGGVALALARERGRRGADLYDLFDACHGDLDRFADRYTDGALVYALWGELLLRGVGNSSQVRRYLRRAVSRGSLGPRTLALCGWAHLRLPWPGSRPLLARLEHHHETAVT